MSYLINGGDTGLDERRKYVELLKSIFDYEFSLSEVYNDKRACFAWGLWHDPGLKTNSFNTCKDNRNKAIEGYQRFIELIDDDYNQSNWYGINKIGVIDKLAGQTFCNY